MGYFYISQSVLIFSVLLSTMWFGVKVMACSVLFTSLCSQLINTWPNKKLLNYSYVEQLKDILPSLLLAMFMGVCVSLMSLLNLSDILILIPARSNSIF